MSNKYFHAIKIIRDKCVGCTFCVRVCPTEALRVRQGKVILNESACIDCGRCVRACSYHAIQPVSDPLSIIKPYKYKLAILSTPWAGQFTEEVGYNFAKKALLHLGFDEVAEEAQVTNISARLIRDYIRKNPTVRPILSSSCPSVVRLIQVRFTSLLPNLLHLEAPMSILSKYYRERISKEQSLNPEEIGIFLIVPCTAQVTAVHQPEGAFKRMQEGAIAISDVYREVMGKFKEIQADTRVVETYPSGLSWAIVPKEGESINDGTIRSLAVSGVKNIVEILSKIENHQFLEPFDFVVLRNCTNGCVGGIFNVENPFVAGSRIRELLRTGEDKHFEDDYFFKMYKDDEFSVIPLEPRPIMQLDSDIKAALAKLKKINEILTKELPGLDCSACGSPTCRSLAEDIIDDKASIEDCVVKLRNQLRLSKENKHEN